MQTTETKSKITDKTNVQLCTYISSLSVKCKYRLRVILFRVMSGNEIFRNSSS